MSKYSAIPPVGQINDMACWAACLKWWYKAEMSINASQTALWDLYKGLELPQGDPQDRGGLVLQGPQRDLAGAGKQRRAI